MMPFNYRAYRMLFITMLMTGCIGDFKQIEVNICPLEKVHPNNMLNEDSYECSEEHSDILRSEELDSR